MVCIKDRILLPRWLAYFLAKMGSLVDAILIALSMYGVLRLSNNNFGSDYVGVVVSAAVVFYSISFVSRLYGSWRIVRIRYELLHIFKNWLISVSVVGFLLFFFGADLRIDKPLVLVWFAVSLVLIGGFRCVLRLFLRYFRAYGHDRRVVCFIGVSEPARRLAQIFRYHPWMGVHVRGFFDDRTLAENRWSSELEDDVLCGSTDNLLALVRKGGIDGIYIALPMAAENRIKELIDKFSDTTVSIYYCPALITFDSLNARVMDIFGQPVISLVETPFIGLARVVKRVEDVLLGTMLLLLSALPMLLIAIAIKATSRGPVFYRQWRYGLGGQVFRMWKFRSMYSTESDEQFVQAAKGDARVTPLGAVLRKTSLDELPQLFNVIKGEMSIVGPRPHPVLLNEYHRGLIHRYMLRHKVKPGVTGLAQVGGCRGETDNLEKMERRVQYDLTYMRNWSLWLDLKILVKTIAVISGDRNAY